MLALRACMIMLSSFDVDEEADMIMKEIMKKLSPFYFCFTAFNALKNGARGRSLTKQ